MCSDDTATRDSVRIPLYGRNEAIVAYTLVDVDIAEWASQWKWRVISGRYAGRWIYDRSTKSIQCIYLHREILGLTAGNPLQGDHINRVRLDNRRGNLRAVTHAVNAANRTKKAGTSSIYRGVSWSKRRRLWEVSIRHNGERLRLGYFKDEHEAGAVAKSARARISPYLPD